MRSKSKALISNSNIFSPTPSTQVIRLPDIRPGMNIQSLDADGNIADKSHTVEIGGIPYALFPHFELASGGFGSIVIAQRIDTHQFVAFKVMASKPNAVQALELLNQHDLAISQAVIPISVSQLAITEPLPEQENENLEVTQNATPSEVPTAAAMPTTASKLGVTGPVPKENGKGEEDKTTSNPTSQQVERSFSPTVTPDRNAPKPAQIEAPQNLTPSEGATVAVISQPGSAAESLYEDESLEEDDTFYIVPMKLIPGNSIREFEILNTDFYEKFHNFNMIAPIIRLQLAINIIEEVLEFLKTGYVHRDLQAANILIDPLELAVTLIDFDFKQAKDASGHYHSQSYKGSILYAALEFRMKLQAWLQGGGQVVHSTTSIADKKTDSEKGEFVYRDQTEAYPVGIDLAKLFVLFTPENDIPHVVYDETTDSFIVDRSTALQRMESRTFVLDDPTHVYIPTDNQGKPQRDSKGNIVKLTNNIFPTPEMLSKFIAIIKSITSNYANEKDLARINEEADKRDLVAARDQLIGLKQELLKYEGSFDKVLALDVSKLGIEEFTKLIKNREFHNYIHANRITHIILVDTSDGVNTHNVRDYVAFKQALEMMHLTVNSRVFNDPNRKNLEASLINYLESRQLSIAGESVPYRLQTATLQELAQPSSSPRVKK